MYFLNMALQSQKKQGSGISSDWKKKNAVLKFFAFAGIFLIFPLFLSSCGNRGGIDLDPVE